MKIFTSALTRGCCLLFLGSFSKFCLALRQKLKAFLRIRTIGVGCDFCKSVVIQKFQSGRFIHRVPLLISSFNNTRVIYISARPELETCSQPASQDAPRICDYRPASAVAGG